MARMPGGAMSRGQPIEPLMMLFLGVVIGGMVIALRLPMSSRYAHLQQS